MKLTEHDKRTPVWLKLQAYLNERLELHRSQNDGDIPNEQTQRLRGKIAELKLILALNEPVPTSSTDDADLTSGLIQAGFSQE